jgi:hypothetical protein
MVIRRIAEQLGVTCATVLLFAAALSAQEVSSPLPAVPVNAIVAIVDAFRSHRVVALGEGPHGNEQGHAFRLALIRDPRVLAECDDVLVECGNGRYQDVMDRLVSGAEVSHEDLRRVWQDTTVGTAVWDRPIYEEFFRAVLAGSEHRAACSEAQRVSARDHQRGRGAGCRRPPNETWQGQRPLGGGELFRSLLAAGLVDGVCVSVIPVLLGGGIPLLPSPAGRATLKLGRRRIYEKTGTVGLWYDIERP